MSHLHLCHDLWDQADALEHAYQGTLMTSISETLLSAQMLAT